MQPPDAAGGPSPSLSSFLFSAKSTVQHNAASGAPLARGSCCEEDANARRTPHGAPSTLVMTPTHIDQLPGGVGFGDAELYSDDVVELPTAGTTSPRAVAWAGPDKGAENCTTSFSCPTTTDGQILCALRELHASHEKRVLSILEEHEQRLVEKIFPCVSRRRLMTPPARPASTFSKESCPASQTEVCTYTPALGRRTSSNLQSATQSYDSVLPRGASKKSRMGLNDPTAPSRASSIARATNSIRASSTVPFSAEKMKQSWIHGMLEDRYVAKEKHRCSKAASRLTTSRVFEGGVATLIILNAVAIGAQATWTINNLEDPLPHVFRVTDLFFVVAFTLELVLRLVAEGASFFSMRATNFGWNLFDAGIVASTLVEELLNVIFTSTPNFMAVRLVRLMRLVRVVRAFRVARFFRDLRIMVAGIMTSLKSYCYALILLFIIIYITGVMIMQVLAEQLAKGSGDKEVLLQHFHHPFRCMLTLYMSICGGIDWGDVAEPLIDISPLLGIFFALYVAFGALCVLNIITGVFVENASQITAKDEEVMVLEELASRSQLVQDVKSLFMNTGGLETDKIGYQQFAEHFDDAKVQAYFKKCGVDVSAQNPESLFQLFDFNGDGSIDIAEFAAGIQQIHGMARAIDIVRLRHETKIIRNQVEELLDAFLPRLDSETNSVCE